MREVELMRALGRHQHIVQLIGYTQAADGDVTIILEYCEKGNLLSYLRKEVRQQMENASKVELFYQRCQKFVDTLRVCIRTLRAFSPVRFPACSASLLQSEHISAMEW